MGSAELAWSLSESFTIEKNQLADEYRTSECSNILKPIILAPLPQILSGIISL